MTTLTSVLYLLQSMALAACPSTPDQVEGSAREAVKAFAAMDAEAFSLAHEELREGVACLSAAPSPEQAAVVHLAEALASFQAKDTAQVLAALQAMQESDPGSTLSADVAPVGGPLHGRAVEASALPPAPRVHHELRRSYTLVVDGRSTAEIPTSRSSLVVVVAPGGQVVWSGLVSSEGLPPTIGVQSAGAASNQGTSSSRRFGGDVPNRRKLSRATLLAAGGSALVAGGLWVAYAPGLERLREVEQLVDMDASEQEWHDAGLKPMTDDEIGALYDRARALELSAQAATGLTLGLGVVGVAFRW